MDTNNSTTETKEIVPIAKEQTQVAITKEFVIETLRIFGQADNMTDREIEHFAAIAVSFQLNPLKREIYCQVYEYYNKRSGKKERKLSIITGYEVYLKRAERSGKWDGMKTTTEFVDIKGAQKLKAIATVYRKDWSRPLVHEVWFGEYKQESKIWKDKPVTMLKKVCLSQALRLTFPDECGGIPYSEEEIAPEKDAIDVTAKTMEDVPEPPPPGELDIAPQTQPESKVADTPKDLPPKTVPQKELSEEDIYKDLLAKVKPYDQNYHKEISESNKSIPDKIKAIEGFIAFIKSQ